ncbi:MAG: recombinase family protein, partial [Vicinamibacterales bacterium]
RDGYRGPRGARWGAGAVKRVLANEKYTGQLIWGQKTFERRPGTRQLVARAVPREQWRVQARPDLRIVADELWARVQARRRAVRQALPAGHALMRGRNAALHSRHLFSGFLSCASCGGALTVVSGGHGSPRYGCLRSWKNGVAACPNRLTIRATVVDAHLLEGLKAELLAPATVTVIAQALASALNRRADERPRLAAEAHQARTDAAQRLQRLIEAIQQGVAPGSLAGAIQDRQADLARLDATLADLTGPLPQRLAVMPAWVRQQLEDVVGLLRVSPERTKAEFQHLGLHVTMARVTPEGERAFYRATVESALPGLMGMTEIRRSRDFSAVDRLDLR